MLDTNVGRPAGVHSYIPPLAAAAIQLGLFISVSLRGNTAQVLRFLPAVLIFDSILLLLWWLCDRFEPMLFTAPMVLFSMGAAVRSVLWIAYGMSEQALSRFFVDTLTLCAMILLTFFLSARMLRLMLAPVGFLLCTLTMFALCIVSLILKLIGCVYFSIGYQLSEIPYIICLCAALEAEDFDKLCLFSLRRSRAFGSETRRILIVGLIVSGNWVILIATGETGTLLIEMLAFLAIAAVFRLDFRCTLDDVAARAKKLSQKERAICICAVALMCCVLAGAFVVMGAHKTIFNRIIMWLSPFTLAGDMEQTHQHWAKAYIAHGGTFGCSELTELYTTKMPAGSTDMIFAHICQLFGVAGGLLVVLLFSLWTVSAMRSILVEARDDLAFSAVSRLVAVGGIVIIFAGALIHIASNTGVGILCGMPLPLISRGRGTMIVAGIIIAFVARRLYSSKQQGYSSRLTVVSNHIRNFAEQKKGCTVRRPPSRARKLMCRVTACLLTATLLIMCGAVIYVDSLVARIAGKPEYVAVNGIHAQAAQEVADISLAQDNDIINILLLGLDESCLRSDTNKIISIDTSTNTIRLVTIQRDCYVTLPTDGKKYRFNAAYAYGGAQLAIDTVESNFRVGIDGAFVVKFDSLISLIDEMGGIDIDISCAVADELNACTDIARSDFIGDAVNHLSGREALYYARIRRIDDNFGRADRQNILISAITARLSSLDIGTLISIMTGEMPEKFMTTFDKNELRKLCYKAADVLIAIRRRGDTKLIDEENLLSIPIEGYTANAIVGSEAVLRMYLPYNTQRIREYLYGIEWRGDSI